MVLHEELQPKCNTAITGSQSSKKNKDKKIPQRGLGVAQLEKIRIEEEQKQKNNSASSSSSNHSHSLLLPLHPQPQPSLPFLTPHGDPNTLIRFAINSSSPTIDFFKPEQILMNNKSTCLPILSGVNLQMEPPSNQNYNSNYFINSSWREEERSAGMNVPWPETGMPFSYKLVPHFDTPFFKPEESWSMCGKSPLKFEYKSTGFSSKEGGSSSNSYQVDWRDSEGHRNKRLRENVTSQDSAFLTLALLQQNPHQE